MHALFPKRAQYLQAPTKKSIPENTGNTNVMHGFHTRARQRQDNKTNVESVHSYDAFHTRSDKPGVKGIIGMHRFNICLVPCLGPGVKGIIGMHRFNICLVVVLLWYENYIRMSLLIFPSPSIKVITARYCLSNCTVVCATS